MKRTALVCTALSVLLGLGLGLGLVACDVTQELQGSDRDDAGTATLPDGSTAPGADASTSTTDAATPPTDAGTDAKSTRQLSICAPRNGIGSTTIVVNGGESAYFRDVHDLQSGAGRAFALSGPWTFVGAPLAGGAPVAYDVTATLPTFLAFAIAPLGTNPGGALTTPALASYKLPTNDGQILALRGSRSMSSEIGGRVLVDGGDVFYFQTTAPSRLVHASTAASPTEQLVVEYPTASGRAVTAAALVGTYVYFATAITTSGLPSQAMLHRAPRAGGAVEDLVSLASYGQIEGIHEDAGALYLTPGGEFASVTTELGIYTIATNLLGAGSLQGNGDILANARTSGVAFDGTAFYYGSGAGTGCSGRLVRVSKSTVITRAGKAEVLATNLDRITRVRVLDGKVFVGTAGDAFFKPQPYPGQMLRWAP